MQKGVGDGGKAYHMLTEDVSVKGSRKMELLFCSGGTLDRLSSRWSLPRIL